MPRRHLFALVVLLGAVAVAGLLALTRTVALGSAPTASSSSGRDATISFRLRELDRLEASLRKQLAAPGAAAAQTPVTVYRRSSVPAGAGSSADTYEHEDDDGGYSEAEEGRDD